MSTEQVSQQDEQIYNQAKRIQGFIERQKQILSKENLDIFLKFNDEMIVSSISESTRYRNLNHFSLLTKYLQKNWNNVTEADLRELVAKFMIKHGENGKESGYTRILKISLKGIVRFVKLGSRNKPENGELPMLLFIKPKKVKEKLTREDLPTDQEIQKLLAVCADSSRDKAMIAVHGEAGTRIGELLTLKIKDFVLDKYGGLIKVKGKTGTRSIRIVKSVPYLTRWLNDHPDKDNSESPMWVYVRNSDSFGKPVNYYGFNRILHKRVRQAGITKRIYSHLFRHKEVTDFVGKLTEAESRMRHGWEKSSTMPSKYAHMNQEDLDEKILQVMGMKKPKIDNEPLRQCTFCKITYPLETRFCDTCSRPLDVSDAIHMEKEQDKRTRALIMETLRQEHSNKSKSIQTKQMKDTIDEKSKEIDELKKIIHTITKE